MFLSAWSQRARLLLAIALVAHSRIGVNDGVVVQRKGIASSSGAGDAFGTSAAAPTGGLRCLRPSAADVAAAVTSSSADDAAALLVYGAGRGGGIARAGDGSTPLAVAEGDDVCFLLLVQQPMSVAVHMHRPMDKVGVLPDDWDEEQPRKGGSFASQYPHPEGAVPDDVLLRLHAGVNNGAVEATREVAGAAEVAGGSSLDGSDTFVLLTGLEGIVGNHSGSSSGNNSNTAPHAHGPWLTASVRVASLKAASATWHSPPRFTAYAGAVPAAAVARLAAAAAKGIGNGTSDAPLCAALGVHVEHSAFTWASGPPRTAYACSGGENGGCSLAASFDDVGVFKHAHLPLYAPVVLPLAHFTVMRPRTLARAPAPASTLFASSPPLPPQPPCPANTILQGYWAPSGSPGGLSHATNDLSWHATGCALRAFDTAAAGACLARVSPPHIAFVGDSHVRRHFKDLHGRGSAALLAWWRATAITGSPHNADADAVLAADARALDVVSTRSTWCGSGTGGVRYSDVDCACSDVAYGPTEFVPNPLETFYGGITETRLEAGGVRASLLWLAGFTEPEGLYNLERAMLERGDDEAPAGMVIFDLVHWDAAFGTISRFEHALPSFVEWLHAAFPPPAVLVFRTPTFYAGDDIAAAERYRGRRYMSHGKVVWMGTLAMRALRAHKGVASRLRVWDVYTMGAERQLASTRAQTATSVQRILTSSSMCSSISSAAELIAQGADGHGLCSLSPPHRPIISYHIYHIYYL